jgi:hypothetical protein
MTTGTQAAIFSSSRVKLVPQAIVNFALLLPLGLLWLGLAFEVGYEGGPAVGHVAVLILTTAVVAFLIWYQILTLRRVAKPDVLNVTSAGLDLTMAGRRRRHSWTMLGEPEMRRLSGKSVARSIILPLNDGSRVVIPAEEYACRAEDMLRTLTQARAGLPFDPPQRASEALYLFLAIPAACLVLGIVLMGLGAIIFS